MGRPCMLPVFRQAGFALREEPTPAWVRRFPCQFLNDPHLITEVHLVEQSDGWIVELWDIDDSWESETKSLTLPRLLRSRTDVVHLLTLMGDE